MNRVKQFLKNLLLQVPLQEQVMFARHLAIMSKAGIPLLDSLKLVKKQTRSKALAKILEKVVGEVSNGQFLSSALEPYLDIFGNFFINVIKVGEASGGLSENLNYLADELKKKQTLKKKVVGALVYPVVVLVATFGITGLLIVFIFPKILPVFASLKVQLPITTRILIAISNILTHQGHWFFLGLTIFLIIVWLLLKVPRVRFAYHHLILEVPVFKKMFVAMNTANITRTIGLLLKSGVKIVEAINITGNTLNNLVYKKELAQLADSVSRGGTMSKYLLDKPRIFPLVIGQMVEVGESTGNLSETLLYLSEFYESELEDFTKNLSNVLEPLLMVLMGTMVGFVAISIITPIYQITQTVGNVR